MTAPSGHLLIGFAFSLLRILLVGAGGVGAAFCAIAARRDFFELFVVSDYDEGRARQAVQAGLREL